MSNYDINIQKRKLRQAQLKYNKIVENEASNKKMLEVYNNYIEQFTNNRMYLSAVIGNHNKTPLKKMENIVENYSVSAYFKNPDKKTEDIYEVGFMFLNCFVSMVKSFQNNKGGNILLNSLKALFWAGAGVVLTATMISPLCFVVTQFERLKYAKNIKKLDKKVQKEISCPYSFKELKELQAKTEKTIELNATDKAYMAEKIATLKQELINLKIKYNNISNHNLQKVSEHQTTIEA